ncbi:hypothetical protein [Leekyejoonella antrihumi]|uniref:Uncharacterized protein n=1 Tax=Leekyejoonella antrihumi TaxID=1660198 RepID=A0A563DS29_9MICO|nr:hypothetical protein [Leekyejoonella antrihumi]TWP33057.1 hypothetical protein FGL98_22490 [Leekyejoonella antrihumi]
MRSFVALPWGMRMGVSSGDVDAHWCRPRDLAPGSLVVDSHPATVTLKQDWLLGLVPGWLDELFALGH